MISREMVGVKWAVMGLIALVIAGMVAVGALCQWAIHDMDETLGGRKR